jgi:hypothetical protein
MASKKKKNKVTKATPPVEKGVDFKKLYNTILTEAEKQIEIDKLLKEANTKSSATGIMQVTHPPMQQVPSNKWVADKSYKTALHAQMYGKAGQMGVYAGKIDPWTGDDAVQHKWLTWMKQQMQKLHPGVTKVSIEKDIPWYAARFNVSIHSGSHNYLFVETASMELLSKIDHLEAIGHEILKKLKLKIDANFPTAPKAPGNMTVVSNPYMDENKMLIMPKDMHMGFENYIKSIKDANFKGLGELWLANHKPPEPVIPVPPDEDKEYSSSPVIDYNNALQKIENHAKTVSQKNIWGSIEADVLKYTKQKLAEAKVAQSHGFRGSVVQDSLKNVLPCLYEQVKCPDHGCTVGSNMANMIIHLNDDHLWTREAIADWAESLDIDISVKETE